MKKVAKLVRVSLVTRVIVYENATEQEILELAIPKLSESLIDNPYESVDEIVDDTECPYDEDDYIELLTKEEILLGYKAKDILSAGGDLELTVMLKKIINHENSQEIIDYIDGVQVWEPLEYMYTVKGFLKEVGFTGKEFKD